MSAKRALVVDDSRSARLFLSRILERHEIAVDAAETAEQAIEYLARHRPDVIFMDHMMPGMDGFQAVQAIKNNPRTSSIPILMYTSQEGDLYLGQARALGAAGVLPKQIRQADVTRMLFQLRLVEDRRGEERISFAPVTAPADLMPANEAAILIAPPADEAPAAPDTAIEPRSQATPAADVATLLPQLSLEIKAAIDTSLQREISALRGFLGSTLAAQSERLQGDLAVLLPPPRAPELDVPTIVPERRPWGAISGWTLALVAGLATGWLYWTTWTQGNELAVLRSDLSAARTEVDALRARPEVVSPAAAPDETFVADDAVPVEAGMPAEAGAPAAAPAASGRDPVPSGDAGPASTPVAADPAATAPSLPRAQ